MTALSRFINCIRTALRSPGAAVAIAAAIFSVVACGSARDDFSAAIAAARNAMLLEVAAPQSDLPYFAGDALDPVWDADRADITRAPGFSLQDHSGATFTERRLDGRITALCFFFTRCGGYCPGIMRNMQRLRRSPGLDAQTQLVSITITPDLDSPAALQQYRQSSGFTDAGWQLLTGDRRTIYSLARDVFRSDAGAREKGASPENSRDAFVHSEHIYLLDSRRRLRGVYNGNVSGEIARIVADIKSLKQEESRHEISL